MLVGFFKDAIDAGTHCRVIHYTDRIWLEPSLAGTFLRTFTIEVESGVGIKSIRMLLPTKDVSELKGLNDTAFDQGWFFNSNTLRSAGKYEITQNPSSGHDFGVINDDGLNDIKVFVGNLVEPVHYPLADSRVVQFKFPDVVKPGEKVHCRLRFSVPVLATLIRPGATLTYSIELPYFAASQTATSDIGIDRLIPVLPSMGGANHKGGFSVFVYAPPGYVRDLGFDGLAQKMDRLNSDGTQGEHRTKFVWQLRKALEDAGRNPQDEVTLEREYRIVGSLVQRDSDVINAQTKEIEAQRQLIDRQTQVLQEQQSQIKDQKREIRIATIVAIIAIVISVITAIPFFVDLFRPGGHH